MLRSMKPTCYAIDFGTTHSLLAPVKAGDDSLLPLKIDPTALDPTVLKSVLLFAENSQVFFGDQAIKEYAERAGEGRLLRSIKKFLPRKSFISTQIHNKKYSLADLISRFLREMKQRADQELGIEVDQVVLGRPAKFSQKANEDQLAQNRLEAAAKQAGFKEIAFFPEPLAAAFDFRSELQEEKIVLVVDLGGGTSDFTVIKLGPRAFQPEDVLSLGGVSIAGDVLDGNIMREGVAPHFGSQVQYQLPMSTNILTMPLELKHKLASPADITLLSRSELLRYIREIQECTLQPKDSEAIDRLFILVEDNLGFHVFERIEKCKIEVCGSGTGTIELRYPGIEFHHELNEDRFEELIDDSISKILGEMELTLKGAGLSHSQIDLICCTGGTSKVPMIQTALKKRFGEHKIRSTQMFHSVIRGLAERAKEVYF